MACRARPFHARFAGCRMENLYRWRGGARTPVTAGDTAGYLNVELIEENIMICDLGVRSKAWRSRARGAQAS